MPKQIEGLRLALSGKSLPTARFLVGPFILVHTTYEDGTECSERRHIKFRFRGIAQKNEYKEVVVFTARNSH
jgi:hypothetical protein